MHRKGPDGDVPMPPVGMAANVHPVTCACHHPHVRIVGAAVLSQPVLHMAVGGRFGWLIGFFAEGDSYILYTTY